MKSPTLRLALLALFIIAAPAQAIYQCKDANGDLAFQNDPCSGTLAPDRTLTVTPPPLMGTVLPPTEAEKQAKRRPRPTFRRFVFSEMPAIFSFITAQAPDLGESPADPVMDGRPNLPTTPPDPALLFYLGAAIMIIALGNLIYIGRRRRRNPGMPRYAAYRRRASQLVLVVTPLVLGAVFIIQPDDVGHNSWSKPASIPADDRRHPPAAAEPPAAGPQVVDASGTTTLLFDTVSDGELLLQAKRKGAGNAAWDAPLTVAVDTTTPPDGPGNDPAAVADRAGTVTAVWLQVVPVPISNPPYLYDFMASRYDAGHWSSPVRLGHGVMERDGMFRQPIVDAAGNVTVFWGYGNVLHASHYRNDTHKWTTTNLAHESHPVSILQAPNGDLFAGWSDSMGIAVARFDRAADVWKMPAAPFRHLLDAPDVLKPPVMHMDSSGNITVVWYEANATSMVDAPAIFASRYEVATQRWTPATLLGRAAATEPDQSLVMDARGNITVAWRVAPYTGQISPDKSLLGPLVRHYHDTHRNVALACHYDMARRAWGNTEIIASNTGEPALYVDKAGTVSAEWTSLTDGKRMVSVRAP